MTVTAVDPALVVTSVAAGVASTQPYTAPTAAERVDTSTGLARLAIGDLAGAQALLGPLGFTISTDDDPTTGRRYALAVSETTTARAWGLYLVDLSAPLRMCVAVPHPKSDAHCEQLALRLWAAVPGSMLAMAAVHRGAECGTADHSQNTESVFHHLWTTVLGPRGVPQIQIHGFANASATEQVVVSTGAGAVTPAAVRVADEIAATGLETTRNWDGTANPNLDATTNEQGKAANAGDWVWLHAELNRTVRDTANLWHPAMDAIAAANLPLLAYDRPSPGGQGHFPKPVGSANTTGTSRYFAREDHIHRGTTGPAPITITDSADLTIDAHEGTHFRITLHGNRTLATPTNGTDGQQILIEALAANEERTLTLHPSIHRSTNTTTPITIPAGKRWFGTLIYIKSIGWLTIHTALQT